MAIIIIPDMSAASAAAERRTSQCISWIHGYIHEGSTSDQMRYYADCVNWLHPIPDDTSTFLFKAVIIAALIGVFIGAWMSRNDDSMGGNIFMRLSLGSLLGSASGISFVMAIIGIWYGAKYVVS